MLLPLPVKLGVLELPQGPGPGERRGAVSEGVFWSWQVQPWAQESKNFPGFLGPGLGSQAFPKSDFGPA